MRIPFLTSGTYNTDIVFMQQIRKEELSMNEYGNLFYRSENNDVAYTHNGVFHADDVCCAALLKYTFPSIQIKRVSELPANAELAFDIGGGKYDHHKEFPKKRENDVVYSSFGLLWQDIGPLVIPERYLNEFDFAFVSKVDFADTTGKANQLSFTIRAMNPSWDSDKSEDECFDEAVRFVTTMFKIHFETYLSRERGYDEVKSLAADSKNLCGVHTLLLPKYIPYLYGIDRGKIYYVAYPAGRVCGEDGWTIHLTNLTRSYTKLWFQRFPLEWEQTAPPGTIYFKPDSHIVLRTKVDMMYAVKYLENKCKENRKRGGLL